VRAESNPEAGEGASAEAEVVENVEATEAEVESEEAKSPWKPRVKLGDVMGVIHFESLLSLSLSVSVWFLRKSRRRKEN
jgi:hypothetical protein